MASKCMKYDAVFKLKVVQFAKENSNASASLMFSVNERQVRDLKKAEAALCDMPRNKCANRGKACQWPELEKIVEKWVSEQPANGHIITRPAI